MMRMLLLSAAAVLVLSACKAPEPPSIPGGNAAGMALGVNWDDSPITVGKGELEDKAVVITYFTTW
jgi:hypothetical protein